MKNPGEMAIVKMPRHTSPAQIVKRMPFVMGLNMRLESVRFHPLPALLFHLKALSQCRAFSCSISA
jgi:hypothetical protein